MKKIVLFSICALALASCTKDKDLFEGDVVSQSQVEENVKAMLGADFNMNQPYDMLTAGEVAITANIDASTGYNKGDFEVAKVQILTGNPFYDKNAVVLNESSAALGQTVTLNFDAPNELDYLYAAVVSKDNRYRVKPFAVGDSKVTFGQETRATRAAVAQPMVTDAGVVSNNAYMKDTLKYSQWKNSYWADKLYDTELTSEDLTDFNAAEKKDVNAIIDKFTPEKIDNRKTIQQTEFYVNTANYFTTTQTARPIKVTPVHSGASIIETEKMYYFYYDPKDVEGMNVEQRAEFLQKLPKYHLLDCKDTYDKVNWQATKRAHSYTLAYFGKGEPTEGTTGQYDFPSGLKIGFMLYAIYPNNNNDLASYPRYTVNLYTDSLLNSEVNLYDKWSTAGMGKNGRKESRAAIFGANGTNYVGFEDWNDNDFNDVVFAVEGGVEIIDENQLLDKNVYSYAFEDTQLGDYDLNDVVIKAQRLDVTRVVYSLEATGAQDEVYIKGLTGSSKLNDKEVHAIFGVPQEQFVNTRMGDTHIPAVYDTVTVSKDFTFAKNGNNIYIYNKTKNLNVKLATTGQDPHGILIPCDWQYPQEKICVKDAFLQFNAWGRNRIDKLDWYKYPEAGRVYTLSVFKHTAE